MKQIRFDRNDYEACQNYPWTQLVIREVEIHEYLGASEDPMKTC